MNSFEHVAKTWVSCPWPRNWLEPCKEQEDRDKVKDLVNLLCLLLTHKSFERICNENL